MRPVTSIRRPTFIVVSAILALTLAGSARDQAAPADDLLLGTWHLVVEKSTYKPGPAPRSQTRIYEKHPFGVRATVKTAFADGRSTTVQTVYAYGDEEFPVTGSEDVDTIKVKRVNAYTHEATMSHAGATVGTFRRVIAKDGKQMTVTLKRRTPPADNVEVYEKAEEVSADR